MEEDDGRGKKMMRWLDKAQGGMYGSDTMLEISNGDNEEAQMKNSLIE